MRYYGSKEKLLNFIAGAVRKTKLNGHSLFVDLFSGTSSVGKYFKMKGYTVYANDILEFCYALSRTYIQLNSEPNFEKLNQKNKIQDGAKQVIELLNDIKPRKSFIYKNYCPTTTNNLRTYFTDENGQRIDAIREKIQEWFQEKNINEDEYYYLITSLLEAINKVSNVAGTYAACLKTWDKRAFKKIKLEPPVIIKSNNKNKAFKEDANNLIKKLKADILYLDPPYNTRQYASNYFILELIAEGWFYRKPNIYGKTGMKEYSHQKSKYSSKVSAPLTLKDLIDKAKYQFLLLSYNNEGIIPQSFITSLLKTKGNLEIFQSNHKRYRSINQTQSDPNKVTEKLYFSSTV
jgi:adenine-specific DNA methylase